MGRMKLVLWLFIFLLISSGSISAAGSSDDYTWETVVPGIEYNNIIFHFDYAVDP